MDPRLELQIRTLTPDIQLGQPLNVEFRLRNRSDQVLTIHNELELSEGFLKVAITDPLGVRKPFLPITRSRCYAQPVALQPDQRQVQEGEHIRRFPTSVETIALSEQSNMLDFVVIRMMMK